MSNIFDSPFLRAFAATNSVILSAGALYLVAFREEKVTWSQSDGTSRSNKRRGQRAAFDPKNSIKDLEEFSKSVSDWNDNLTDLEDLLGSKNMLITVDGIDQVDGVQGSGYQHPQFILEKLDKTLNIVMGKVGQIRQLVKERQVRGRIHVQDTIIGQDFTGADLLLFNDEDSEADSFLSAASDIEEEEEEILKSDTDQAQHRALQVAGPNRDKTLYLTSLELYFKTGIKCRKKRTKMVGCRSDAEFMAKVDCIREASKLAFSNEDIQCRLEQNVANLLGFLIRAAGKDHHECQKRWKALASFCKLPGNWDIIARELTEKGVPYMTFYDIVLDFIIMDAFEDLENPPYSVQATVQSSWLPAYIQQTGLETAVWGVLKAKMQLLQEPAGFLMHFYHLSEILTPVLAWGFLGSDDNLTKACGIFKEQMMGYVQDLFDMTSSNYISLETLSEDVIRLADLRYDNLRPLLSQPYANGK